MQHYDEYSNFCLDVNPPHQRGTQISSVYQNLHSPASFTPIAPHYQTLQKTPIDFAAEVWPSQQQCFPDQRSCFPDQSSTFWPAHQSSTIQQPLYSVEPEAMFFSDSNQVSQKISPNCIAFEQQIQRYHHSRQNHSEPTFDYLYSALTESDICEAFSLPSQQFLDDETLQQQQHYLFEPPTYHKANILAYQQQHPVQQQQFQQPSLSLLPTHSSLDSRTAVSSSLKLEGVQQQQQLRSFRAPLQSAHSFTVGQHEHYESERAQSHALRRAISASIDPTSVAMFDRPSSLQQPELLQSCSPVQQQQTPNNGFSIAHSRASVTPLTIKSEQQSPTVNGSDSLLGDAHVSTFAAPDALQSQFAMQHRFAQKQFNFDGNQNNLAAIRSSLSHQSANAAAGDSNVTLWLFLWELLESDEHKQYITWTNNPLEFKLHDSEHVAKLWGQRKNKPHMNYDKLSRALRYYYEKDIIKKVVGQKFVYKFVKTPSHECGGGGTPNFATNRGFHCDNFQQFTHGNFQNSMSDGQPFQNSSSTTYLGGIPSTSSSESLAHPQPARTSTLSFPMISTVSQPTPSPVNSTSSPTGSVESSSGVSSAGTSASGLSDRVGNCASTSTQTQEQPSTSFAQLNNRKNKGLGKRKTTAYESTSRSHFLQRDSFNRSSVGSCEGTNRSSGVQPIDDDSGPATKLQNTGSLSRRAMPPPPLDLSSVNNQDEHNAASNNLLASSLATSMMAFQNSPLYQTSMSASPFLNNLYFQSIQQQQQSPLLAAIAAASPMAALGLAIAANPNVTVANSVSTLYNALTTPQHRTPQLNSAKPTASMLISGIISASNNLLTPSQHQQTPSLFQFPPSASVANLAALSAVMASPNLLHSPCQPFSMPSLQTPNLKAINNRSPDTLTTPVFKDFSSFEAQFSNALAAAANATKK